jgi:putative transcriptional regulator
MANGHKIIQGMTEALLSAQGTTVGRVATVNVPNSIDVRAIRQRMNMSQREFALRFGFSLATLRHWEQGQRMPEGPARVLLTVIDRKPDAVQEALQEAVV